MSEVDGCSLANLAELTTLRLHLELSAQFDRKVFTGFVALNLRALRGNVTRCVLDTRDLKIESVHAPATYECAMDLAASSDALGPSLKFSVGASTDIGAPLEILLPKALAFGEQVALRVVYETDPNAAGLQWLPAEQTDGKKHPYAFSQFQAIHARSGLPCQDAPAVKAPYTAGLTVVKPLVGLMSAVPNGSFEVADGASMRYSFEQKVPIPSYLIAIAIGHLESRELGPRCRVWCEPEGVEAAAAEFSETESMLKTAEEILTPYEWGRYDLLVLPASFPYGGMENPCLTFMTPTVVAGDKSLVNVVAHELAHSWMGNLVTNRNWESFWLNEGFTVLIERKILGRLAADGDKVVDFEALKGWKDLKTSVDGFGHDHEFTCLCPRLHGVDPDDAFSKVPYERGFQFLYYLQSLVGGKEKFEPFLKHYVSTFKFSTLTAREFRAFFLGFFQNEPNLDQVDWDAWFYKPGMPPVDICPMLDRSLSAQAYALADKWVQTGSGEAADMDGWSTNLKLAFLDQVLFLTADKPLIHEVVAKLGEVYSFTSSRNAEVRFAYYMIAIHSEYTVVYPSVVAFLKSMGRMKFVRPLFRALFKAETGRELALATFIEWRPNYHNITAKMVAKDLGIK